LRAREPVLGVDFSIFGPPEWLVAAFQADSSSCHQSPAHQEQLAEGEQREQLGAVLGEAPVAGLHVAELAFDHPELLIVSEN